MTTSIFNRKLFFQYIENEIKKNYQSDKEFFEEHLKNKVPDTFFSEIYFNCKYFPHINNKSPAFQLKEMQIDNNFRLPYASGKLFNHLGSSPWQESKDTKNLKADFDEKRMGSC